MINRAPTESELIKLMDRAHRLAKISGWSVSLAKNIARWSPTMFEQFNLEFGNHPSIEQFFSYLEPADALAFRGAIETCERDGVDFELTASLSTANRRLRFFAIQTPDEDGVPLIYGMCQDITEAYRQEQELIQTRATLQSMLDHMPATVYSKTCDGIFTFANPEFYAVVPTHGKSVIGLHAREVFPPATAAEHTANDQEIIKSGRTQHSIEHVPQADGSVKYFDSYKFPSYGKNREIIGVTGISIDITEKKVMQNDLDLQRAMALHQSRLASIGELAAGVGHEINNPLTIVMSYLTQIEENLRPSRNPESLAAQQTSLETSQQRNLEIIAKARKASERIRSIVGGLRTFARSSEDVKQNFPVIRAVSIAVNMVKEIYAKEGVEIEFTPPAETFFCFGDEGQLQQVLINLFSNARDAVIDQPIKQIRVFVKSISGRIRIGVTDTGPGIDAVHLARIFDPFFTTKESTKGTGLGLSIAQTIVKEHGGEITYQRTPSGGSHFSFEMPLVAVSQRAVANQDQRAAGTKIEQDLRISQVDQTVHFAKTEKRSLGKILVADDEVDIQEILCMVLSQLGFDADGVGNGKEALARIKDGNYDVLITDMNMPGIKGNDLIRKIRHELQNTKLKIFIITGGISMNLGSSDSELHGLIDGHFYKPFDPNILKTRLFTTLGL